MPKIKADMERFLPGPRNVELLLHPPIPQPLWGTNPRTIFGKQWWAKERARALEAAKYRCQACGTPKQMARLKKRIEVHETYKIDNKAHVATYTGSVALCWACHSYIHRGRILRLTQRGLLSSKMCRRILEHGRKLIEQAGLTNELGEPPCIIEQNRHWKAWRLVIEGVSYKPVFEDYAAFLRGFNTEDEE